MIEVILECKCAICATAYPVKLGRMWLNLHDPCPACGFHNGLSEKQAMQAHAYLEQLRCEQKVKEHCRLVYPTWIQ